MYPVQQMMAMCNVVLESRSSVRQSLERPDLLVDLCEMLRAALCRLPKQTLLTSGQ